MLFDSERKRELSPWDNRETSDLIGNDYKQSKRRRREREKETKSRSIYEKEGEISFGPVQRHDADVAVTDQPRDIDHPFGLLPNLAPLSIAVFVARDTNYRARGYK